MEIREDELTALLSEAAGEENVLRSEPMDRHTTFRIGGPADYFVTPRSPEAVAQVLCLCAETKTDCAVIGNGSNLLVGDGGFRGVILQLGRSFSKVELEPSKEGARIRAQAGAMLASISHLAADHALTGLEFASGIPGTVGGGTVMNAGAYGGELKDVIREVTLLTPDLRMQTLPAQEMAFGYRTSRAQTRGEIILSVTFVLQHGDEDEIRARIESLREQRTSKQPLDLPSAGSTFKRPEGYFAGKLIMDAGLRGYRVGGAQVSEKHCGFVVNRGGATAADVVHLMEEVKARVLQDAGVELEPEIRMIGEFA